jgi:hypothetical protein
MSGRLDFSLPKPDWLNFGGLVATELTVAGTLPALTGAVRLKHHDVLEIVGTLPALSGAVLFTRPNLLRVSGTLPALGGRATLAVYFPPPRGPAVRVRPTWQKAEIETKRRATTWAVGARTVAARWSPWNQGLRRALPGVAAHQAAERSPIGRQTLWSEGRAAAARWALPYHVASKVPHFGVKPWAEGRRIHDGFVHRFAFPTITPIGRGYPWDEGARVRHYFASDWQVGIITLHHIFTWWNDGRFPWPGGRFPRPRDDNPYTLQGRLEFRCFKPGALAFGATCFGMRGLLVPWRRSYRVLNSGSMVRRSDGADVPVSALSVGIDWDSWCWSLTATVMTQAGADLIRTPGTEVTVTINDFVWGFVVDSLTQAREFGKFSASVAGRSLVAGGLAEPYSAKRSYIEPLGLTAQQLALQELPPIGGWAIDWEIPDWTVPARVYQYQNLTPIDSILRLARSAGGIVQAARDSLLLTVAPRWPREPWAWTFTADATLPASYVWREQLDSRPGVEHDVALISGGIDNGILLKARRAGQPGDSLATTVVDALIVHAAPAVARGVQEIADRWPRRQYRLVLPLQAQPEGAGLLLPGLTVDFDEGADGWRGLVTGTRIDARFGAVNQVVEAVSV